MPDALPDLESALTVLAECLAFLALMVLAALVVDHRPGREERTAGGGSWN